MTDFSLDTRTIEQFLDDYEEQKKIVEERQLAEISTQEDCERLTAEEQKLLNSYNESKELLNEARNALDFVKCCPACFCTSNILGDPEKSGNRETVICSLIRGRDYANSLVTLTGGGDERMQNTMESLRTVPYHSELMDYLHYKTRIEAPLKNDHVKFLIEENIGDKDVMQTRTVASVAQVIDYTKQERERWGIRDENIIDDTVRVVMEEQKKNTLLYITSEQLYSKEELAEINDKYRADVEKEKEPVTATISNDGYVMNTSEEITQANVAEYDQIAENGNEVRDNGAPRETTNDLSKVGGNVKYEEASDVGSLEAEKGEQSEHEKKSAKSEKGNKKGDDDYERS